MISFILVLFWILLWKLDIFEYKDSASPQSCSCDSDHRRFLAAEMTAVESEEVSKSLPDEAYLVAATLSVAVVFLVMEYPGWVVMILSGCFLSLTGTITETAMWHAMSFPTLIACCAVTAVAKGLANTHIMSLVMEKILDFERGDFVSLSLLFFITGLISTIIDNFAVIGIFQYVYAIFSKRTGIEMKVLMMPLSFISMIGGTCTVLASGAMLVAKSFLEEEDSIDHYDHLTDDQKNLTMFEMSIAAFPVLLISAPILAFWSVFLFSPAPKKTNKLPLPNGSGGDLSSTPTPVMTPDIESADTESAHHHKEHGFIMKYRCTEKCKIQHLHKIADSTYPWKEVSAGKKRGLKFIRSDQDIRISDIVYILAPGTKIQDLALHNFQLLEMNPERNNEIMLENHVIAEGIVDPNAVFVGKPYSEICNHVRHWHVIGMYHAGGDYPRPDILHTKVKGGDILLLEGDESALLTHHKGFIQIGEQDSHQHDIYTFQLCISGLCFIMIIVCTVMDVLTLLQTVIISLLILVQTHCLTIDEMLHKFKWRVLLLITGAYAIAHAFVDTKLAEFLTQKLLDVTDQELPMLIILYILSVILGMAFPPKAAIGILYPICLTLAQKAETLNLKKMIIVVLQGTAIQLLTPNNPENSLIADQYGYVFSDFVKCGLPIAFLSGIIFIPLVQVSNGIL